jgi:hypothetical protein
MVQLTLAFIHSVQSQLNLRAARSVTTSNKNNHAADSPDSAAAVERKLACQTL